MHLRAELECFLHRWDRVDLSWTSLPSDIQLFLINQLQILTNGADFPAMSDKFMSGNFSSARLWEALACKNVYLLNLFLVA